MPTRLTHPRDRFTTTTETVLARDVENLVRRLLARETVRTVDTRDRFNRLRARQN